MYIKNLMSLSIPKVVPHKNDLRADMVKEMAVSTLKKEIKSHWANMTHLQYINKVKPSGIREYRYTWNCESTPFGLDIFTAKTLQTLHWVGNICYARIITNKWIPSAVQIFNCHLKTKKNELSRRKLVQRPLPLLISQCGACPCMPAKIR